MKKYNFYNNLFGWITCAIACAVFCMTIEPTASFWDCGEYIATTYKLMVGHPPGAPTFQLTGRLFTLFAGNDLKMVSILVNIMSALMSGFTILFLFWSITALARKILIKTRTEEVPLGKILAIMGAGLVGGLAYTFTDSFWFSAVEGEVYATSSFYTAIVFWLILKWDYAVDTDKYANKWIVLCAFLMGLSIGVHLLNLLAIPAITFVYYFKKYKTTKVGIIKAFLVSVLILGLIQFGIIPWVVKLAAYFELFFVNSLGLPFNSGTVFYFIVLIGGIIWGLWYTRKKGKVILNTIVLCVTFIIIGYSTFLTLVIRSNANTPLNENAPKDAISLLSFLLREQYGDWPIGYGQYYNAPLDSQEPYKDGTPVYTKDEKAGKYIITDARKNTIPNYDSRFCTIFPRMYSSQSEHITGYKNWGNVKGTPIEVTNNEGKTETLYKPTFGENLRFFFSYQLGHMYLRYFMWNFVGRQNDIQGNGGSTEGNWLSGIKFIDEMRLGPQDNLPDFMSRNKGMNKFYFLPLILGLLGLIYHYTKDKNNFFVVLLFFFMTGIAINIYLNPVPYQPRERDYAYAGSFYVFAIWIGLGVIGIYDKIGDKIPGVIRSIVITLVCLLCVPVVMAKGGWNDHDRSHRYTSTDFAKDYLMSCEKDAILFTNGDNDTFPLWNVQEVEGFRTDVKVVNLSLLNTDWYIDQMKRKTYDGDPVPFSLTNEKYRQGTRDYIYFIEDDKLKDQYQDVKDMIDFVSSDDPRTKYQTSRGLIEYFPSRKFSLKVDSTLCLKNGTVSGNLASQMVSALQWDVKGYGVMKNSLMVLDLLAHFNWKRPVYFAITTGNDSYIGLDSYMQLEGLAYRLVPIKTISHDGQTGRINTDKMYDNLMYKFKWGNMDNPKVYLDETNMRMTMNFRNNFARLANELINEGKISKAIKCLDRCLEVMPEKSVPYNYFILPVAEAYYRAGAIDKANNLVNRLSEIYDRELNYYFAFNKSMAKDIDNDKQRDLSVMQRLIELSKGYKQDVLAKNIEGKFKSFYNRYMLEGGGQQQRQQGQPEQQQD